MRKREVGGRKRDSRASRSGLSDHRPAQRTRKCPLFTLSGYPVFFLGPRHVYRYNHLLSQKLSGQRNANGILKEINEQVNRFPVVSKPSTAENFWTAKKTTWMREARERWERDALGKGRGKRKDGRTGKLGVEETHCSAPDIGARKAQKRGRGQKGVRR